MAQSKVAMSEKLKSTMRIVTDESEEKGVVVWLHAPSYDSLYHYAPNDFVKTIVVPTPSCPAADIDQIKALCEKLKMQFEPQGAQEREEEIKEEPKSPQDKNVKSRKGKEIAFDY